MSDNDKITKPDSNKQSAEASRPITQEVSPLGGNPSSVNQSAENNNTAQEEESDDKDKIVEVAPIELSKLILNSLQEYTKTNIEFADSRLPPQNTSTLLAIMLMVGIAVVLLGAVAFMAGGPAGLMMAAPLLGFAAYKVTETLYTEIQKNTYTVWKDQQNEFLYGAPTKDEAEKAGITPSPLIQAITKFKEALRETRTTREHGILAQGIAQLESIVKVITKNPLSNNEIQAQLQKASDIAAGCEAAMANNKKIDQKLERLEQSIKKIEAANPAHGKALRAIYDNLNKEHPAGYASNLVSLETLESKIEKIETKVQTVNANLPKAPGKPENGTTDSQSKKGQGKGKDMHSSSSLKPSEETVDPHEATMATQPQN